MQYYLEKPLITFLSLRFCEENVKLKLCGEFVSLKVELFLSRDTYIAYISYQNFDHVTKIYTFYLLIMIRKIIFMKSV